MNLLDLIKLLPNSAVAISAIWLMVQFRKELVSQRAEVAAAVNLLLNEARADRNASMDIVRNIGEGIARIEHQTRVVN